MSDYFGRATRRTRDWVDYLEDHASEYSEKTEEQLIGLAFKRAYADMKYTLRYQLSIALSKTKDLEFNYEPLSERLYEVFDRNGIIHVTQGGEIYLNVESVAGDISDFWDGVNFARAMVAKKRKLSPDKAAEYWKKFIYMSAESGNEKGWQMYEDTIGFRLQGWGELAPYWIFLDSGTVQYDRAYPHNPPTDFVYKAQRECQYTFDDYLITIREEENQAIEQASTLFVDDPESKEPWEILNTFYAEGREYVTYITPTRQIGTALTESYRRMKREAYR